MPEIENQKSKIENPYPPYRLLDAWRGVAALWVALHHFGSITTRTYPELNENPVYLALTPGYLGVQMFFVISGYCIAQAAVAGWEKPRAAFLWKRFRRIYPPFWASMILTLLAALAADFLVKRHILHTPHLALQDVLAMPASFWLSNAALVQVPLKQQPLSLITWTLCYEISFYLIVAAGMLLCRRRGVIWLMNALHAVTALSLLAIILFPSRQFFPFELWPQFGMGVLLFDLLNKQTKHAPVWCGTIALLTLLVAIRCTTGIGYLDKSGRVTFLFCIGYAALLYVLARCDDRLSKNVVVRFFSAIGLISYSLYLTHPLVLLTLKNFVKISTQTDRYHVVLALLSIGGSVGFAWLFWFFVERHFGGIRKKPSEKPVLVSNETLTS